MAEDSKLQLKRKREGEQSQRNKAKKARRSNAGPGDETVEAATPVNGSTESQVNGMGKEGTPSTVKKSKKEKQSKNDAERGQLPKSKSTPTSAKLESTPIEESSKKRDKNGRKETEPAENVGIENTTSSKAGAKSQLPTPQSRKSQHHRVLSGEAKTDANRNETNAVALASQLSSTPAKKKKQKSKSKSATQWQIAAPIGGWFLPQDPVFSSDEKYLFLANARALQVYATDTSLLVNTLPAGSSIISAYALASSNPDHMYVANAQGIVTLWNWNEGSKVARWDVGSNVRHMKVIKQSEGDKDLVFCHESGDGHVINIHALRSKTDDSLTDLKNILKTRSAILDFQVLLGGRIVVVACPNSVSIGRRIKAHKTALQDFEYVWREVRLPKRLTAFNAYVRSLQSTSKSRDPSQEQRTHLDLALGDQDGVIHLFEDILSSLASIEQSHKKGHASVGDFEGLRPKRLHWHREAVGSVKWSQDGNYLISGGDETVLVIWQLSTGKQQTLPHLTAAIENIIVSPVGSSYSVSLANNSVIVLSTTELKAKSNIVGTQSRRIDLEQLPKDSSSSSYSFDIFREVPMVVDAKNPSHILISVPSSQPPHQRSLFKAPEPYLQTFDISSQRDVSRQALTRNNATDPNVGPERTKILEPNIKYLQTSCDGNWLASVDEWTPPSADLSYLEEGIPEFNKEERSFRREVYLKIWRWDEQSSTWTLASRIDSPHMFPDVGANGRVLDLTSNPTRSGFATIGEDLFVRLWGPTTRTRDGVAVRGAHMNLGDLVNWSVEHSIEIGGIPALAADFGDNAVLSLRNARLAYSADGSVLAVAVSWQTEVEPGVIHIVDAETGRIRRSITEVNVTALCCLGIIGRHLVVVADSISVWDLVADELVSSITLDTPGIGRLERTSLVRLAVNEYDGTFAVACPHFEKNETSKSRHTRQYMKTSSKIYIYDPLKSRAQWHSTVPDILLSLAATKNGSGYIGLDAWSCIRIIAPKSSALQLLTPPPESEPQLVASRRTVKEEDEDGEEVEADEPQLPEGDDFPGAGDLLPDSENDKPVVRPEQLQQIFDAGPSHALPPVKDLFSAVVGLYARKPRASNVATLA